MADYKKLLSRLADKWPAKVLSVVAAIFLFTFHRMGEVQERFFSIPLQVDAGVLVPAGPWPRNIRISLRGDGNSVYRVVDTDIEAWLDLSSYAEPGNYRIPVRIQRKGSAAEIETLEIGADPAELSLELDLRMTKTVPVIPVTEGYPETGYELVSSVLEPGEALVDGPAKLVAGISVLKTEPVELRNRNGDFTLRVKILSPNPLVAVRDGETAEFRGTVRELIIIKNFENLPVAAQGLSETFKAKLEPETASVRIQGSQKELDALNEGTLLGVDLSGVTRAGIYDLPLQAAVGETLSVDRLEPETILVEVTAAGERGER